MNNTQDCCSICSVILKSSGRMRAIEVDGLSSLIMKLNYKLLEESLICAVCLTNIQWAYQFKSLYLENSQKTLVNIKKEWDSENCVVCKNVIDQSDCVSLFDSVTEIDRLNLIKYLSEELETKSNENLRTCEFCHKSTLNFCTVIDSLSVFDRDKIFDKTVLCKRETLNANIKEEPLQTNTDFISTSTVESFTVNVKTEIVPKLDVKDEIEYKTFMVKNEEIDLKMDCEDEIDTDQKEKIEQETEKNSMYSCNNTNIILKSITTRKLDEPKIFHCVICKYSTNRKNSINRHMLTHKSSEEVEMFRCETCEFQTKHKKSIERHMLVHKSLDEVELFKCQVCEFQTKHKLSLSFHMSTHRSTENMETFNCEICGYQTNIKKYLQKHMRIHKNLNDIKLFGCPNCDYLTKHKGNLKKHSLIHISSDEVDMFKCHVCEFQTRHKNCIRRHILIHKSSKETEMFKCQLCEYQTKRKGNLQRHLLTHESLKPVGKYKCGVCEFRTKYKVYLEKHENVHKNSDGSKID